MSAQTKPIVALVSLRREWLGISRLPESLSKNGLGVVAICQLNSFLANSSYVDQVLPLPPPRLGSYSRFLCFYLIVLLQKSEFIRVIPGDEDTVYALQDATRIARILRLKKTYNLLLNSIGKTDKDVIINKCKFWKLLQEISVPTPSLLGELKSFAPETAVYPVVIKQPYSSGGSGVSIVNNISDYRSIVTNINRRKRGFRKVITVIKSTFFYDIYSYREKPYIESFIKGFTAMYPFLADKGSLIGGFSVKKIETFPPISGPSSVIESFRCQAVQEYVELILARTRFSGFGSIDFMLEEITNKIYVIEFNPRPVPASHLGNILGSDLCKLFSQLCHHKKIENDDKLQDNIRIALFPNEVLRDENSLYIKNDLHDVPWNDERLLKKINSTYDLSYKMDEKIK